MTENKEAFDIMTKFARRLFSSTPTNPNKRIRVERIESGELLINGKPSLYKQIIKECSTEKYT